MVCVSDHLFKLVVVGDSGVGKSSIMMRFSEDAFSESYISTIGVDFKLRTIELHKKRVRLQIWDTAGQERFRTITSAYYRGADGILLVYDVTDMTSFEHVDEWMAEVDKFTSLCNPRPVKILLGNKGDLETDRQVERKAAETYAAKLGIPFFETSAKTNTYVDIAFYQVAESLLDRHQSVQRATVNTNKLSLSRNGTPSRGHSCCK